ncbi:MAG: hypothetical protein M5R42_06445 [Rhodocyclaceae bacterium]|nr:hypothetical protein [Rhodocyclaceae bacterium]
MRNPSYARQSRTHSVGRILRRADRPHRTGADHGPPRRRPAIGHVGPTRRCSSGSTCSPCARFTSTKRCQMAEFVEEAAERYPDVSLRKAAIGYSVTQLSSWPPAIWLPFVGEEIAT